MPAISASTGSWPPSTPRSDRHDELLFIIIHQTKELWLKQIIHEVKLAKALIRAGELEPAYKALARVSRIQAMMTLSGTCSRP